MWLSRLGNNYVEKWNQINKTEHFHIKEEDLRNSLNDMIAGIWIIVLNFQLFYNLKFFYV